MDIQCFDVSVSETLLLFCTSLSPQPEIIIDEMSRKKEGERMGGERTKGEDKEKRGK